VGHVEGEAIAFISICINSKIQRDVSKGHQHFTREVELLLSLESRLCKQKSTKSASPSG
jgi:hypothetical protein